MSSSVVAEINRRLRAAGILVHEAPGWQTRGNGQTSAYEGGLVHHTATGYGNALPGTSVYNLLVNGRSDLAGPLCNYAGNADGSITCIAAGPANHAGSSGGRSMGPLPVTSSFNRRVLGLEIVYPGTQPMRDAQTWVAQTWARVVADVVGGGNIERVRAHAETSVTGKWDPGVAPSQTIDMTAFRAAAAQGEDMTPEEHRILAELHEKLVSGWGEWSKAKIYEVLGDVVTRAVDASNAAGAKADAVSVQLDALADRIADEVQVAVAAYFSANPPVVNIDHAALARAVNDDADLRARDNDPATGPRT